MTSAEHAMRADELLEAARRIEAELRELTPERKLELAVVGAVSSLNADLRYTVELAQAHAMTALALAAASAFAPHGFAERPAGCSWGAE